MIDYLHRKYESAYKRWLQLKSSRFGKRVLSVLQWLFVGGVITYLVYQLTTIGWTEVWTSLPTTAWFYILLLLMYITLPITEAILYGQAWSARYRDLLPVLFRKRVLNNDVLGYSGEAYFYLWIKQHTNLSPRQIAGTIKDNMIISSLASTTVAFLLLAVFFLTGQITLLDPYLPDATSTLIGGLALLIGLVAIGITFRQAIFSLHMGLLGFFTLGHLIRFVLNNGFQVLQWAVVLPEVHLGSWITLLALYIVINQIPLIPARGLFFLSAGVELSSLLQIPTAAVASMLLTQNLIDRGLNLLVYAGTTAVEATGNPSEQIEELSIPEEIR